MRISVIIPVFRRFKLLRRSLTNLCVQLRDGDEVVVVAFDMYEKNARAISEIDSRIRIIRLPRPS